MSKLINQICSRHDIVEILLKLALKPINQSIHDIHLILH